LKVKNIEKNLKNIKSQGEGEGEQCRVVYATLVESKNVECKNVERKNVERKNV